MDTKREYSVIARAPSKAKTPRRAMPKQARRKQLIKATMQSIGRNGLSATTMADITRAAGLSTGIVNLHFESKEKLLVETLRSVANEYKDGLDEIFNDESISSAEKLLAHVNYDFSKKIVNRNKLSVWFAFWGEARSRPVYSRICAKHDKDMASSLTRLFTELIKEGAYHHVSPRNIATAYTALADGLWLDLLITPRETSPEQARNIAMDFLSALFSKHFPGNNGNSI
ncbi:MAG TPA: transcriptional regulator BetI [Gammaproteobacteria bacterium]|nr:transcriptional regulator BetI [Gammaproteobacteria bacterium]